MAATLMAATSSGTLKATPFLGQGKGANANALRDVVSMGTGKYTMVLFFFMFYVLLSQKFYGVDYVVWLICYLGLCFVNISGQWFVVWTRQSEILGTLLSSDPFILERRIPWGLWMGHCWLICWPRSICQEQGSWGSFLALNSNIMVLSHSFFKTNLV